MEGSQISVRTSAMSVRTAAGRCSGTGTPAARRARKRRCRLAGVRGIRAPLYALRNGCPNKGIWDLRPRSAAPRLGPRGPGQPGCRRPRRQPWATTDQRGGRRRAGRIPDSSSRREPAGRSCRTAAGRPYRPANRLPTTSLLMRLAVAWELTRRRRIEFPSELQPFVSDLEAASRCWRSPGSVPR